MKKQFAVIGLGRFGGSVCRALIENGMEVLAIDRDEAKVEQFRDIATHAVIADTTDEKVLKSLGIRNFDHVIVAIGDDIQASILTTLILVELGVPHVTAKALNAYHAKVLNKVGAEKVVHPERDMGVRIAHHLISKNILDYLELSDDYSIVECIAGEKLNGKTMVELNIRATYGCSIIAIKRGREIIVSPAAEETIQTDDLLVVIGADADIVRFEMDLIDS
ncbi:TrkA family potassium uptake protein [Halalkalibacterium halodurans]|jgi:trk system potassium uptake protein TrkA|uniref:Potassium transporter Trk n=1 Tax=Halalkalibacterium halodurans TaxID=86665 RepID=A0A0M0KJJ1_ALKHA|nr:TrkA family potassium uptake protein [Halalkalibacterium halodurans]MED3646295.1 TrkA family potassium uptake protein [Halalkalibacterium halodurans]MED4161421.1 TrkA family potassium uptake protein [Halalkalibacterium halodurans]TES56036.1 TrkA family potassium uptake protein [Halalkalibacterium halodurans]TPE69467.1 TrkA family potassium uptake protein [Halalkalibacterium halodurans]